MRAVSALGIALVLIQLSLLPLPRSDGHLLSSDGGYYYCYLRSALLDGDLDIANDVALYNARVPPGSTALLVESYVFSVGPGLLWSPFFLVGHGLERAAAAVGWQEQPDGFGFLTEASVQLASVAYAAAGLLLLVGVASRLVPDGRPPFAVLAMFLASPAVYYAVFEPTMSHTLELFTVSLFLWRLIARPPATGRDFLLLGLAGGLVFLVRWQNAVLWIVAAPALLERPSTPKLAATVAGGAAVVSLQLLFWKVALGSFATVPQGEGFLTPLQPRVLEVLFSTRHGLLSWHPALALGLVGMAFLRPRPLAWSFAIAFAADLYVCSIAGDWWGGSAFGMRRMTGAVPLLAIGFAAGLGALGSGRARALALGSVALLVAWNFAFMLQYRVGAIPPGDALTFRQMVTEKLTLPAVLARKLAG